ncbi:hypothetical protein H257_00289 [Aphanomyces astaci]|uniref:FAD dependent oxidoreductase domain-containing protein n=1 Tax=Aphanomyces astaci TaxID=112090 RepID=W4HB49_APHAT|nr:hypothetical protein H257_00289 [Aphanomyces astaci]ETV88791.1 hypothetical protein H257_00289 [Aphanomyces astaci]|eukprot:XP_009821191.1 hypothetical protein H257_00289 [Aphanomyces astaci]
MSGAVVIVGAGVVGLTTALQLILDGVSPSQITIVAKDGPEKSTSFVAWSVVGVVTRTPIYSSPAT